MRVIPAIDLMGGQVVRLLRGNPADKTVYSDDPLAVARRWEDDGADMLHIVDLDAAIGGGSKGGRGGRGGRGRGGVGNLPIVRDLCRLARVPVEIAGGLRTEDAVSSMLDSAPESRVVVGTLAFAERAALRRLLERYGPHRIVVSADHSGGSIVVDGWQRDTGVPLLDGVASLVRDGAREFLLTDVGRDGAMTGPDLDWLRRACAVPCASVIASGGISSADDVGLVRRAGAAGVVLGRALYEGRVSVQEAKRAACR